MNTISVNGRTFKHNLKINLQERINAVLQKAESAGVNVRYMEEGNTVEMLFVQGTYTWVFAYNPEGELTAMWFDGIIKAIFDVSIDPDPQLGVHQMNEENTEKLLNEVEKSIA